MSNSQFTRRIVLKGLGASVALPWLESIPSLAAEPLRKTPPKRFAFLFFGACIVAVSSELPSSNTHSGLPASADSANTLTMR